VEEIVAKVNNRILTKSEFEQRGQFILSEIYRQFSGASLDRQLEEAQNTLLANMITELLLLEKAETLLDLEKVRLNLIDDFKKQQGITTDEEMEGLLKEQGMTRKDLEEQLLRLAVPQEIIGYEVRRKISVSEREIEEHYRRHLKDFETPPTLTLREIVLFYEAANRPEVEARAQGILRELKGGADFTELVARHSEAGTTTCSRTSPVPWRRSGRATSAGRSTPAGRCTSCGSSRGRRRSSGRRPRRATTSRRRSGSRSSSRATRRTSGVCGRRASWRSCPSTSATSS
jgi:hypothetical protein